MTRILYSIFHQNTEDCRDSIISIRSSDPSVLFVKQQLEQESPPEHIQNLALSLCRDDDPFSWNELFTMDRVVDSVARHLIS